MTNIYDDFASIKVQYIPRDETPNPRTGWATPSLPQSPHPNFLRLPWPSDSQCFPQVYASGSTMFSSICGEEDYFFEVDATIYELKMPSLEFTSWRLLSSHVSKCSRVFVYDVMTYKLSQLGHYVHWQVTVVHAVNVSTIRRRVELSWVVSL